MSGIEPHRYQEQVAQRLLDGESVILQAPTGAGKTAAALLPYLHAVESLDASNFPQKGIYAVPMRVLANQFEHEYKRIIRRAGRSQSIDVKIQTGERPEDREFEADLTFATIDQVLSSWLMHPYSLPTRLGNLNAGALVGSYLVFDEFHLFDPDSTLPTTLHMLKTLHGVSPFMLMTATFSAQMLETLAEILGAEPFLLTPDDLQGIGSQEKERRFFMREEPLVVEGVARPEHVLAQHRAQDGETKRSIIIFNQVERAQRFYQALRPAAEQAGVAVRLLHSRFRAEDRKRIEDEVRREFGKEKDEYQHESMILVATQVIEVGLDATCPTLHTELAPAASVLQRAGRCARYQGEQGDVFVYPVENLAPYSGREAKKQCERTREWLEQNQDRHLSFDDEQTLVNHAHGSTDRQILAQLEAGAFQWAEEVRTLWSGAGDRSQAQRLIRDIQSQSLIAHPDPDSVRRAPFAVESFSLHPGTIYGKFESWLEAAQGNFDRPELPWAVCKLAEVDPDEEANRPVQYEWVKVKQKAELAGAPLLAVHPSLVGYRDDLGLTLFPGETLRPAPLPPEQERSWTTFYRLESYGEHVRLVHEAFREEEAPLRAAAGRLEQAFGWRPGLVGDMAHLVVWLHDLGKLGTGWQQWAWQWQQAIGRPANGAFLAHTDYDGDDGEHVRLEKEMRGRRPPHAVESALAAIPYLQVAVDGDMDHSLFRAAFSAIARHHAPSSHHSDGFQLVGKSPAELDATMDLLPAALQKRVASVADSRYFTTHLDVRNQLPPNYIAEQLLIDPASGADMCSYMLLVRALRRADQLGTKRGSERSSA